MSNTGLQLKKEPEVRRFKRVKVSLEGALRIPGFGVEMVQTKNISEGGVGLNILGQCCMDECVDIGSEVQLHLNGILSGKDSQRLETYAMKVVYLDGGEVGLSFTK